MAENKVDLDVHGYSDYRLFLSALYQQKKLANPRVSSAMLARKLGITAGHLKNIFARRRHIGINKISSFSQAFQLSEEQNDCFLVMVLRELAADEKLAARMSEILTTIRTRSQ